MPRFEEFTDSERNDLRQFIRSQAQAGDEGALTAAAMDRADADTGRSSQCRLGRGRIVPEVPLDGFMKELITALVFAEHDFFSPPEAKPF